MREIGAFEAKNKLSMLLDWVEAGEEVLITRHGRPVARLVPDRPGLDADKARAAAARIRARAATLSGGRSFEWDEWKAFRDEGRP
jgi:prevent-host-death family protein